MMCTRDDTKDHEVSGPTRTNGPWAGAKLDIAVRQKVLELDPPDGPWPVVAHHFIVDLLPCHHHGAKNHSTCHDQRSSAVVESVVCERIVFWFRSVPLESYS